MVQDTFTHAQTTHSGHGRVERRRVTASSAGVGCSTWPALQQVCQVERTVSTKTTGEWRRETVAGVTNLPADQATAAMLLTYVQQHWIIATTSHGVRDVTFAEDRAQVRTGARPAVLAALRCATRGLLRAAGATTIAATWRHYAAQPWAALALLGIVPQN